MKDKIKITKQQRRFLRNFVVFNARLYQQYSTEKWLWDNDPIDRCSVGPVAKQCLNEGLIEDVKIFDLSIYRATRLAKQLECKAQDCSKGSKITLNDDGYSDLTGEKCDACDGTGLVLILEDEKCS